MTLRELRDSTTHAEEQARQLRADIKDFPRGIRTALLGESPKPEVVLWTDHWTRLIRTNVDARVCSLSTKTQAMTVVNVVFGEGGYLEPHAHDRMEVVHVMDGEYVDPVTNRRYRKGDRQIIAPYQEHGIKSDYALLSITWEPPYPEISEA